MRTTPRPNGHTATQTETKGQFNFTSREVFVIARSDVVAQVSDASARLVHLSEIRSPVRAHARVLGARGIVIGALVTLTRAVQLPAYMHLGLKD